MAHPTPQGAVILIVEDEPLIVMDITLALEHTAGHGRALPQFEIGASLLAQIIALSPATLAAASYYYEPSPRAVARQRTTYWPGVF